MLEPIVAFFDKLVDQFTWRRLVLLAVVLSGLGAAAWGYESYTQHFKLARIERQAAVVEKLAALGARKDVSESPKLREFVGHLQDEVAGTRAGALHEYEVLPWARKALAAGAAWLALGVILLVASRTSTGKGDAGSLVGGVTVIALPFIALSTLVPTDPLLNYVLYPLGHIFVVIVALALLVLAVHRRQARRRDYDHSAA